MNTVKKIAIVAMILSFFGVQNSYSMDVSYLKSKLASIEKKARKSGVYDSVASELASRKASLNRIEKELDSLRTEIDNLATVVRGREEDIRDFTPEPYTKE